MNTGNHKILIAYFSHSGNTRVIAEQIRSLAGGDLFEISTVNPYPRDYNAVLNVSEREKKENSRPELTAAVENMADFDVIIVGYPNWWGTMPMAVWHFLEQYDLSGKTILPFCTHEGSALGSSEKDIIKTCPGASVLPGLAVRGSQVKAAQNAVANWLRKAKLIA